MGNTWQKLEAEYDEQVTQLDKRLTAIQGEVEGSLQKIKVLENPSTIKYMENDIARLEQEMIQVEAQRQVLKLKKPYDIQRIRQKLQHIVEHLSETARQQMDGIKKSSAFQPAFP